LTLLIKGRRYINSAELEGGLQFVSFVNTQG